MQNRTRAATATLTAAAIALGAVLPEPSVAGERAGLSAVPRAASPGVDLADVVGGGDGSGTGAGQGIDPFTGGVVTEQSSALDGPFNVYATTTNPYVDGVFVPDGSAGPVQVSSTGIMASGIPSGVSTLPPSPTFSHFWNYREGTFAYAAAGDRSPWLIGMHANKGITFDLDAISGHHEQTVRGFEAVAAMAGVNGFVEFQVLVDGQRRFRWSGSRSGSSRRVRMEILPGERFLTLVASSVGNLNGDQSYFGVPMLRFTPPSASGHVLPSRAVARFTTDAAKTRIDVAGTLDLGAIPTPLDGPVTLTVAGTAFEIPALTATAAGRRFTYRDATTSLTISRGAGGTSRATFGLTVTGRFDGLTREDPLDVRFDDGLLLADGRVHLRKGVFLLSKSPFSVETPDLSVQKLRGVVSDAGADRVDVTLRFPTMGVAPVSLAGDVEFGAGELAMKIPPGSFVKSGRKWRLRAPAGAVTSLVLDYGKGTATARIRGAEIGPVPAPASRLRFALDSDGERRSVEVVVARTGGSLRY